MPDRSRNRPRDISALAAGIVGEATGEEKAKPENREKDPAAVALGRKGGLIALLTDFDEQRPIMHYNFPRPHQTLSKP